MLDDIKLLINDVENLIKYDPRFLDNKENKYKTKIKKLYKNKNIKKENNHSEITEISLDLIDTNFSSENPLDLVNSINILNSNSNNEKINAELNKLFGKLTTILEQQKELRGLVDKLK